YRRYFERHNKRFNGAKTPLDAAPRVVLVPGVGLFGVGATAKEASVAADIAETSLSVISDVERSGVFESISERDQFDIEYWSLEQAKLAGQVRKALHGHVAVV